MATANQNTSANEAITVTRATLDVNNSNKADRTRNDSASVVINLENGNVESINNGFVREKDTHVQTASFYQNQPGGDSLNMTFYRDTDREAEVQAVEAFIADVKAHSFNL